AADADRPAPATATEPSSASEVLRRAEAAYDRVRTLEADFVQRVYVPLLDQTVNSRGKIYSRFPDRFAMRFTEPAGDVIVADGRYLMMYHPSDDPNQLFRSDLAASGQQPDFQREFLLDAANRYSATSAGIEE